MATRTKGRGWMGVRDAAESLGLAEHTVRGLINQGRLPAYRLARVIRVRRQDLDDFVRNARVRPGALDHLIGVRRRDRVD